MAPNIVRLTDEVQDGILSFRYGYAVQDDEGNDFNQQEQSDGEQVTINTNKQKAKANQVDDSLLT